MKRSPIAVSGTICLRTGGEEALLRPPGTFILKALAWKGPSPPGGSVVLRVRIPAPEGVLPLLVEHAGSYLQEEMRSTLAPSHLLFLHHSLAHDLTRQYGVISGKPAWRMRKIYVDLDE